MAETLLNKIINKEISVELFIKWFLERNSQEQYFGGVYSFKCSRTEFLTYFLNFLHEEILCLNKYGDGLQKPNGCRRVELLQHEDTLGKERSGLLVNEDMCVINKSASYPLVLNTSLNGSNCQTSSPTVWGSTSTPKLMKVQSEYFATNAHVSPVSPLYKNQATFSTPTNEKRSFATKSTEKITPLCLGDFIVNRKSSTKKKANRNILMNESFDESSKRIKPTFLNQVDSNSGFRKSENSFNSFENTKEMSVESVNDNRNFLVEERLKILSRRDSASNITVAPSKKMSSLVNSRTEIEPDVNSVTNKEELGYIVEIYGNILRNNLVLNITSEIYFLISLLLIKHFSEGNENVSTNSSDDIPRGVGFLNDEDKLEFEGVIRSAKKNLCCSDLFETVHNVVYFATRCLEAQMDILKYYDKSTLNLLSQNNRLRIFSNCFTEKLRKISEKKSERILSLPDGSVQTNICFNSDTDNRENFPSDPAFQAFRKQRDIFYDVLRCWEQQHLIPGWNFSVNLGGKIKGLFSLHNEPATFVHFSRLFKAQLLGTCGRFQKEEGLSDLPFLSSIPNVDADKLNRLTCRLVTKQTPSGINSVPHFTGHQEFYKDFIVAAANYTFNKHLCDTLTAEIIELNDTKFSSIDLEETNGRVDPSTKKAFTACLKSLRILAKFLGFVESLPYKSDCITLSEKVLDFQINLRKEAVPPFDTRTLLETSIKQNSLILTVPWLTKYLAMLDYVTLRLPYYVSVHKILFNLHRNCDRILPKETNSSSYKISLIKYSLGWLFELPHFPDSEYFNFCTDAVEGNIPRTPKAKNKAGGERKLDDLDIIDQNILYMCCPYLEEIKKLLSSNALNRSVTVKHITPVTAVQSSNEIAKKRLEHQLEEAFFNGQPLSVRKTVEFVSERVASACVKHICNTIVPPFKKSALETVKEFLGSFSKDHNVDSPSKEKSIKTMLRSKVNQMVLSDLHSLKENCEKEVIALTEERISPCISNLLSVDVLSQTRDICVAITTKMCTERVQQWINSHVTPAVFMKEFHNEIQKVVCPESRKVAREKPVFLLPTCGSGKSHNEGVTSAFHLLEKLKNLAMNIMENSASVNGSVVDDVLDGAYSTLTERSDVNDCITMSACTLLVDVSLLLITHKPSVMLDEMLLRNFVRVWMCYNGKIGELFKSLLCPRNVILFAQSCNEVKVWETFASFVVFLLKENVLSPEEFEAQCTGFYQREWDQGTLNNYTTFLRKFLEFHKTGGGDMSKFTLLLEFLSDFCTDL